MRGQYRTRRDRPCCGVDPRVATVRHDQLRVGVAEVDVEDDGDGGCVLAEHRQHCVALCVDVVAALVGRHLRVEAPGLRSPHQYCTEPAEQVTLAHAHEHLADVLGGG